MESATAAAHVHASRPRCTPCRPPTARRSASPATSSGNKGPIVLAPGLRQRRARVRDRHRAQELGRSTWASTATTCGCSTTARARTCRRASRQFTVDDIAHARLAGGDRHRPARDRRRTRCRRWATASAGCRCSWPSAAAWRACARRRSPPSPATRSPRRATSCAPASAWPTMFKALGIKGLNTDYDPDVAARQARSRR